MRCCQFPRKLQSSVTIAAAGIGKALPRLRDELPLITVGLERKLQNAKSCRVAQFAIGFRLAEGTKILAAGAGDEFANAALGIGIAFRVLGSETLIVMVVAVD